MSKERAAEAKITIRYSDMEIANAVLEAIGPDNCQVPEGIVIEATLVGSVLNLEILCAKGVGSFITTLDDLLACISAAEKAISGL
ncbi:MAG: KEOPS complex subunit Pcc1 [Candidatus Bathyarchaeota archaeon]|nr:KEOPS complex subunit Pcc1 [Candidatus Bathyarchaeota archaeon]